jgi:hypothetical protein
MKTKIKDTLIFIGVNAASLALSYQYMTNAVMR